MGNKPIVMDEYDRKHNLYRNFASEVEHQLRRILTEEGIPYNAITYRLKDRDSLSEKIDRKQDKYTCLGDLTDIAGVRVITYYSDDVDKVADIVEREFKIDRDNSIDKREALESDRFGYCSVHYVVEMSTERLKLREYQSFIGLKCEIQIRSVLQHAWAEIEHDLGYKSEITIPKNIRRNFSRLAGLLEIADKEFKEIRQFFVAYKAEANEKVEGKEFEDAEIDAILLETIIRTDETIKEINNQIASIFGKDCEDISTLNDYEDTIKRLHWFHVYTISQLRHFAEKNKRYAIEISKEYLSDHGKRPGYHIPKTIALFYLCYSELLTNNYSSDQVAQYITDMNENVSPEKQKSAVNNLLKLRDKFNISD